MVLSNRIILFIGSTIIALALILTGCEYSEKNPNDTIENSNIEYPKTIITALEEKNPPNTSSSSEWVSFTEEERIEMSDLIFRGTLLSKKEYLIETVVSEEYTRKNYKTVYSMRIDEIFYSTDKSIKIGNNVDVLSPVTSYNWEPEAVDMKAGQQYILFARFTMDTDTMKFTDLAKYSLGNPWEPIIQIEGDSYVIDSVFESLGSNASLSKRKISGNYYIDIFIRNDENFISDLMELINEYKNQ